MTDPSPPPRRGDGDPPERLVISAEDLGPEPPPASGLPPMPPTVPTALPPLEGPPSGAVPPKPPTGPPVGAAKGLAAGAAPSAWSRLTTNRLSSAVLAGLIGGLLGMALAEVVAHPSGSPVHASGPDGFSSDGSFYNGIALGTGDVQLTLTWDSTDDLDLHVVDPEGAEIFYAAPTAPSGGQLDVDSNAACGDTVTTPVENVFWPSGESPDGHYVVRVNFYEECGGDGSTQDFTVTTRIDGDVVDEFNGTVTDQETVDVSEFDR